MGHTSDHLAPSHDRSAPDLVPRDVTRSSLTLVFLVLAALTLLLSSCVPLDGIPPIAESAVRSIDTTPDGVITDQELRDLPSNLNAWLNLLALGLGIAGITGARRAQRDTDQLYDATHEPKK